MPQPIEPQDAPASISTPSGMLVLMVEQIAVMAVSETRMSSGRQEGLKPFEQRIVANCIVSHFQRAHPAW